MRFLCAFGLHRWFMSGDRFVVYDYTAFGFQARRCERCSREQVWNDRRVNASPKWVMIPPGVTLKQKTATPTEEGK